MGDPKHETDTHDLTLGMIHAVKMLDVTALSYVQLRRLNAALTHLSTEVGKEIAKRSNLETLGKTVRISSPRKPRTD